MQYHFLHWLRRNDEIRAINWKKMSLAILVITDFWIRIIIPCIFICIFHRDRTSAHYIFRCILKKSKISRQVQINIYFGIYLQKFKFILRIFEWIPEKDCWKILRIIHWRIDKFEVYLSELTFKPRMAILIFWIIIF